MNTPDRILYLAPAELKRTAGLYRAAELAAATKATLHIVAFDLFDFAAATLIYERTPQATIEMARDGFLHERRIWLEEEAESLRRRGLTVTTDAQCSDHPREDTLAYIAEMQPTLVVKDVASSNWLLKVLATSFDGVLLRDCPVPLHLVTQGARPRPKRVLAAVDLSPKQDTGPLNERIIACAEKLASQCQAELHLLYAYDALPELMAEASLDAGTAIPQQLFDDAQAQRQQAFTQLAERFGVPAEGRHFVPGLAVEAIVDFAERNRIDAIVMAKVHRNGLDKWLGSTTENVLRRTDSSIVAIRP